MTTSTAQAFSNIACIKYWGNCESRVKVSESFLFIERFALLQISAKRLIVDIDEIVEHELNSPFAYLRSFVQNLSTFGSGDGGSEHVRLGAHSITAIGR